MVIIISGKYIRELRKKIGMSQEELAEKVGVTQAHIAKIETEKVDARLSTINKIISVLESSQVKAKCKNFMSKRVISISSNEPVIKAIRLMKKYNISQLPVIDDGTPIGSIKESTIIENINENISKKKVKDIMEESFPVIDPNDTIETVKFLLDFHQAILFSEKGKIVGIITKTDLLSLIK